MKGESAILGQNSGKFISDHVNYTTIIQLYSRFKLFLM